VNGSSPCPLCGGADALGPAHVLVRCAHPVVAARRRVITDGLPVFLADLVVRLEWARAHRPGRDSRPRPCGASEWSPAARRVHDEAAATASWADGPGAFVLFRLLSATPWTTVSLGETPVGSQLGLAGLLARELDVTRVGATAQRAIANWWVRWAGERTHDVFCVWKDAVDRADWVRRLAAAAGAAAFVPGAGPSAGAMP